MRLLIVLLALLIAAPAVAQEAEIVSEGALPPYFALPDEHGQVHDLEALRGTPTVLYFTHNMCHYCTQIIGFLKRARSRYSEQELAIVTLNVWADGPKLIERYKEQFGLTFPMLAGKDPDVLHDYEVNYVPIVVFIDDAGVVRHVFHHYILEVDFFASVAEIVRDPSAARAEAKEDSPGLLAPPPKGGQ